jgi:hypothetical protein
MMCQVNARDLRGAATEEEGEGSGFKTRDLQPAEVSGEERDMID